MAENTKSTVSQSVISQGVKEFSSRWKYRCNFCREIGVKYLFGEKLLKVPEKDLSIMVGACIERHVNPFMVVIAIMRLLYELTRESFLDRPMYSIRHGWRRFRARLVLMQVLNYLARAYAEDHDTFVDVVMDILTARNQEPVWNAWFNPEVKPEKNDVSTKENPDKEKTSKSNANAGCICVKADVKDEQDENDEIDENENANSIQIDFIDISDDDSDDDDVWIEDDQCSEEQIEAETEKQPVQDDSEMEPPEDNTPVAMVAPQLESNVVFLDADALKEYQNNAIVGSDELKQKLQGLDIILPGPSFRDIDAFDPLAWAKIVRDNFGLNVRVEYVNFDKLPWLSTPMHRSGLSKGDYYIVKYAVYFSQLIPGLRVDCTTPGVMELYEDEMARLRTRESFMRILGGVNS